MEWKKYQSIVRHGKTATQETIKDGSHVVVWEKLDGANASFMLNDNGEIECYSRNTLLSESEGLRGFYQWVHANIDIDKLNPNYIYYGEWLVRHKIDYGENANKFYLFEIFDKENNEYVGFETLVIDGLWASLDANGDKIFDLAPVFLNGVVGKDFTFEDIQSLAGKSTLAPDSIGEGVVIKNYDFKFRDGSQLFTKIVTKEFQEGNGVKSPKIASTAPDVLTEFVSKNVTENRIEKMLHKLVDEGKLDEDYSISDMGTILKLLGSSVAEDVLKEELDELVKVVQKRIGRAVPNIVKKVLDKNGRL